MNGSPPRRPLPTLRPPASCSPSSTTSTRDRKSTRLNSSHSQISYAVFCLKRSHEMHSMVIADSVRAIGRAGAGTNNIPVKAMSGRGVPVFNPPGAKETGVKEVVLAGMLMAGGNLVPAVRFVGSLNCDDDTLAKRVEAEKKQFAGIELPQQTLGVIFFGKIGTPAAVSPITLRMTVLG